MVQKSMYYVYFLESEPTKKLYIGSTSDLRTRVYHHNQGASKHTRKFKPWFLKGYIGISTRDRALTLEKYFKSHSGRTFIKKYFLYK